MQSDAARQIAPDDLFLGVDAGTGKVAAVLTDRDGRVQASVSAAHDARVSAAPGRAEQDPGRLRDAAWAAICQAPAALRRRVRSVGVTGQMHGVLLLDARGRPVSNLVTWQDGRCLEEPDFLDRLFARTGRPMCTGFGCATLAWLAAHRAVPAAAASASTIADWMVAALCGQPRAAIDPTDAASWGLFDLARLEWDRLALEAAGIPPAWMPAVRPCGSTAGDLVPEAARQLGLPPGIPVVVAIGDNQASLLATLSDPEHELALTLGTGGQLSAVLPVGAHPPPPSSKYECRPYLDGRVVLVAATLNGGAAWAWLMESVAGWMRDLGLPPLPPADLYARLNALGLAAATELAVAPAFTGERSDPGQRGVISGLGPDGLSIGPLARGVARGIIGSLCGSLPESAWAGRTRLVGSGNALRRNELLRRLAEAEAGLPLHLPECREEAATGAAMLAAGAVTRGR